MLYIALALLLVIIWLPIHKPVRRWQQLIYGTPILYWDNENPEDRKWRRLREQWHQKDVT